MSWQVRQPHTDVKKNLGSRQFSNRYWLSRASLHLHVAYEVPASHLTCWYLSGGGKTGARDCCGTRPIGVALSRIAGCHERCHEQPPQNCGCEWGQQGVWPVLDFVRRHQVAEVEEGEVEAFRGSAGF